MKKENLFIDGVDYSQKTEDRPFCLPLKETGGVHIYVDADTFKKYMDILQEEVRAHDECTRCLIPGTRKNLIVCHHKCEECPFAGDQFDPRDYKPTVSLDGLYEDYELEAESDEDIIADLFVKERKEKMYEEISLLSEYNQKLLKLYSENKNVREIASELGIGKTKASEDLNAVIELLKEKCKGF